MNKKKAIEIANKEGFVATTTSNSIFANVNSSVNVWWLEPNNQKFNNDLYFLLNNNKEFPSELSILKIPAGTIKSPETILRQRIVNEKTKSSIEIVVNKDNHFIDRKSDFDFSTYWVNTINFGIPFAEN
jgi:hypothetical protein